MKIAVHSDLHTEVSLCWLDRLQEADLLVLAGDIGDQDTLPIFFNLLRRAAPDLPTLYVLGNHEYYGHDFHQAKETYRQLAADYDVRLLDDEAVRFGDLLIAGTTLWSNFQLAGDTQASMDWAQKTLPDFKYIRYAKGVFTTDDLVAEHQRAVAFLADALAHDATHKLVVSHFLPSRCLVAEQHAKVPGGLVRSAYWTSELPELYELADTWIYGHSHSNIELTHGGCRFISNQRGYSKTLNGHENNGYRGDYLINLEE
ncbi:metallophosphoesterase [Suttonella sp. R2A3]|uniref:metallophosphoesterase n=1 Tax=Suttonella sp. R2A3 TaxID=2908648 RepID=UPI001F460DD0|nr:metallophosphoesterase [Suttonella sp. R2A3]UJF25044.1 metallophosphoesterase [Suttonella sp. R2A3]